MLRVTLEIVPFGEEEHKRVIGGMIVANAGGDNKTAQYRYALASDRGGNGVGELKQFERARGAWALVMEVLKHHVPA